MRNYNILIHFSLLHCSPSILCNFNYISFLLHCVGVIDPSEIFVEYFADMCDAIEVNPLSNINRLFSAKLITLTFKEDVQRMNGDAYDKADKIVTELHRQINEKGFEFLIALCDFLLKQNHQLKDMGIRMKRHLESKTFCYHTTKILKNYCLYN